METAEKQVTDVVRVDIHLETTAGGKRYIQRISEIVQLNSATQYPELDRRDLEFSKAQVEREYYYRQTDRISFTSREILAYDLDTDTYYTKERFSPKTEDYMKSKMDPETRLAFESFLLENWGLPPEVKETLENPDGDLDKTMKELNLTGTFGDSLRDSIKAHIATGLSPDDAIKAATNATLGKAKDDIKIGDEKIIENNSKYAWEKPKEQQEIDLSSEFNIGDMGLFDDDF